MFNWLFRRKREQVRPVGFLVNMTGNDIIDQAIEKARTLYTPGSKMLRHLQWKNDFRYDSGTGEQIVNALIKPTPEIYVYFYRPWYIWSAAIGKTDGRNIWINRNRFYSLSLKDVVANLCHEMAHVKGFHHGDDEWTEEKTKYSVPHYISTNIEKWI